MYNKNWVNKNKINCYNSNGSGLLLKRHFIYSAVRLPYIMPALPHFSAGFFVL